jgi:protein phosphatase
VPVLDLLDIRCGEATHVGRVRHLNEDSDLAAWPVYVVADGMGGHQAGDVASATAVRVLSQLVGLDGATPAVVRDVVLEARRQVRALTSDDGLDAGTTLTGAVVVVQDDEPYWLVLNVGDSRTYLLTDGAMEQVSVDHSEVQELVESGELDPAKAARYARRHVVTRALGAGADFDVDYWLLPIGVADRLLVCSDGLTGELADDEIRGVLVGEASAQDAAERLVGLAVERGGHDNVTVLVVDASYDGRDGPTVPRVEPAPSAPPDEPDTSTVPRRARGRA